MSDLFPASAAHDPGGKVMIPLAPDVHGLAKFDRCGDVNEIASDIVAGVLIDEGCGTSDQCEKIAARVVQAIQESDKVRIVAA